MFRKVMNSAQALLGYIYGAMPDAYRRQNYGPRVITDKNIGRSYTKKGTASIYSPHQSNRERGRRIGMTMQEHAIEHGYLGYKVAGNYITRRLA